MTRFLKNLLTPALLCAALFIGTSLPSSRALAQEPGHPDLVTPDHATSEKVTEPEVPPRIEEQAEKWKWPNFAILVALAGYGLYKFLPKTFADRTASIQKDIKEAQATKAAAERRAAEVDARISKLGAEIEAFRTQAAAQMHAEGERIREETAAQVQRVGQQSAMEIENAGKAARRELKKYSAEIALNLAEQRLRGRLDANAEGTLVDNFVAQLGSEASKN